MSDSIKCPDCGAHIDVSAAFFAEMSEKFNADLEEKVKNRTQSVSIENEKLHKKLQEYMASSADMRLEQTELKSKLANTDKEVQNIVAAERNRMEQEKAEAIHREGLRLKDELQQEAGLKVKEKEDVIRQLTEQMETLKRKAEQGSMQTQGEAQELLIEEYLRESFPFDTIAEIKKGALGADCLQVINTREADNCGTIYYESKRTKEFSKQWVPKLKEDMRAKGADIGVIVTSVMPKDMNRFGQINGVWVCTLSDFKSLCFVLREAALAVHTASVSQENKGDKMVMLYDYLTSNEFKMSIEGIVEGFIQMNDDLESEKRSMHLIWKKREKQIQLVLNNTIALHGSLKGIAGPAITDIPTLQLPS